MNRPPRTAGPNLATVSVDPECAAPENQAEPLPGLTVVGGVPPLITDPGALARAVQDLAAGTGPLSVDTERASGYRYYQRAYLLQFARAQAGVFLIDPIACPDLSDLASALVGTEWILHAASQDLPCLTELGLLPDAIFDTELAGRLLGMPRVGLASMVAALLGRSMVKGHSAEDWSVRPIPPAWLAYAALDVVPLAALRSELTERLHKAGKLDWARQEFAAVLAAAHRERPPISEPWRRTAGVHKVRTRRGLALLADMWVARDRLAAKADIAPARVLPDAALVAAAQALPRTAADLFAVPGFIGRGAHRYREAWLVSLRQSWARSDSELPDVNRPQSGPPLARDWRRRDPAAAARLDRCRAVVADIAAALDLPTENLLTPSTLRCLAWTPPDPPEESSVREVLCAQGARIWQLDLTVPALVDALREA